MPFWHFLRLPFVTNAETAFLTKHGDDRVKSGRKSFLRWCNPTDFYIREMKISGYFYELLPNILLFAPFADEFFDGSYYQHHTTTEKILA